jgi:CIC family chloride channel protein
MTSYSRPADNDVPPVREQLGTIVIGAVAGLLAVAFHAVMNLAEETRAELAILATEHGLLAQAGVVAACGCLAAAAVFVVHRYATEAEGSGIAAVLEAHRTVSGRRALRILWVKFLGGFCALSSGMPLGREGPSVQIGAMSAIALRQYGPRLVYYRRRAVELGAAAGLAAAFNAPLSGVVFSFELLKQPFHAHNCFETILACAIADWVCRLFHGPILELPILLDGFRDWQDLPTFALVGLWAGAVALGFQMFLLVAAKRFQQFADHRGGAVTATAIWGCLLGVILLCKPELLGIGHSLFEASIENTMPLAIATLALAARIPLTAISYSTGAPGGLIVPALLFGVLSGQIFSQAYSLVAGPVDTDFHAVCLVAGMAASIGALFRTPLTATIMAVEITGTYTCLLEISIAYVAAHSLLGLARQPDLYTALGRLHDSHHGGQPARLAAARPAFRQPDADR